MYSDLRQISGFITAFNEDQKLWYKEVVKICNDIKDKEAFKIIDDKDIWVFPFVISCESLIDYELFSAVQQIVKDKLNYEYFFEKSDSYFVWFDRQYRIMSSLKWKRLYWELLKGEM